MKYLYTGIVFLAITGCSENPGMPLKEMRVRHYQHAKQALVSGVENLVLVAHRGNGFNAPENSLEALRQCIAHAVPSIEIDVRSSKDGVPVLMHDHTLDRMVGKEGCINDFTLHELKTFTLCGSNEHIPTLEEALDLCKQNALLYLHMKENNLRPTFDLVSKKEMMDSVYWYLDSPEQYLQVPQLLEQNPSMLIMPCIRNEEQLAAIDRYEFPFHIAEVSSSTSDTVIRKLHNRNVTLSADIPKQKIGQNQKIQFDSFWEKGITIIQTDDPQPLLKYLDKYVKNTRD